MMWLAKFLLKLAIFCVVIYFIGIRLFDFGHRLFYERALATGDGQEIIFEIKKGDTADVVAANLEKVGLIDDIIAFRFRAYIYKTDLTPNIYNLNTNMTIKNMLDIFDRPTDENIVTIEHNEDVYQLSPEIDESEETSIRDE